MHYKNGREAKVGDQVAFKDGNGSISGGVLVSVSSQSDTCNGMMIPTEVVANQQKYVTIKDCLHADDVVL